MARGRIEALVFDLEATCINRPSCRVLAAAALPVTAEGEVDLASAACGYEPSPGRVGETALVHGLAGEGLRLEGCTPSLEPVLREILTAPLLVVYGAHEIRLLAWEAQRRRLPLPQKLCYIDLLAWLLRNPARRQKALQRGGLPLPNALEEILGLKAAGEDVFHDPLDDALHTALLYLAMKQRGDLPTAPSCTAPSPRRRGGTRSVVARLLSILGRR
jgi:hypothetical protein